jgi:hypothetical protein
MRLIFSLVKHYNGGMNMKTFSGLVSVGIYLGIGALFHAIFVGAMFDWSSAWTWGWLFGWPIFLALFGFAFVILFLVFMGILFAFGVIE